MVSGYIIDMRYILGIFNPAYSQAIPYVNMPTLREVVEEVGLHRIIECVFVIPSHALRENGVSPVLYEYIENRCLHSLEIFEKETEGWMWFDILVNEITELVDEHIRLSLAIHTEAYDRYVFDNWVTPTVACFRKDDYDPT